MPSDDLDVLCLAGHMISEVVETLPVHAKLSPLKVMIAWLADARRVADDVPGGVQALARTLTVNTTRSLERSTDSRDLERFTGLCARLNLRGDFPRPPLLLSPDQYNAQVKLMDYWSSFGTFARALPSQKLARVA